MFQYFISHISRSSVIAVWCVLLALALWRLSPDMPSMALVAVTAIGALPAIVFLVLAKRPEQTLSETIRETYAGSL